MGTDQWGAIYLFIANFYVTQIIGGTKELWSFCDYVVTFNIDHEPKEY